MYLPLNYRRLHNISQFCLICVGYHSELRVDITFYQRCRSYQLTCIIFFRVRTEPYVIWVENNTLKKML